LANLTTLSLYGNLLTNLSFLSGLTSLTTLNLDYNHLTDASVLTNCAKSFVTREGL